MVGPRQPVVKPVRDPPDLGQCLAKTRRAPGGTNEPGVDVLTHCMIVGAVAREWIERQPDWLREALFPPGSELVAAAHDVGKVCPTFQKKLYLAVGNSMAEAINANPELEENWGGHPAVSQAAVAGVGRYIPEILGRHHGSSPASSYLATDGVFGGVPWQDRRLELLAALKDKLVCGWPSVRDEVHAAVLSGLTTVADWIGSGSAFEVPGTDWAPLVVQALDFAGFLRPGIIPNLSFHDVFGFEPRPVQMNLIEVCVQPGVYVLEAPMGMGKTEAALYAAYRALASNRATGIYFALPTQLTSDKIRDRMDLFLDKVLAPDQPFRKSLLVHSLASLEDFELGEDGQPGRSWFSSTKRGLLAPFAVGTVDQALMAVMNVRHGFVRAFGLAGKVVILDEVHSYDSYTGTLLDSLVKALREIQCTVIILSATLTRDRLASLLGAKGTSRPLDDRYPLVWAQPNGKPVQSPDSGPMEDVEVGMRFLDEDVVAMDEVLERASQGEQVLWVENTVAEAQLRYKILASRVGHGVACGLVHSRYLRIQRRTNESHWVGLYGPDGRSARSTGGRILVGTQVLEQSLDIDADFLVTRLCPTDMLLQRLGRLWRHRENDAIRPRSAGRQALVLSPEFERAVNHAETALGPSAYVYAPYVLCRTLQVWKGLKAVKIPSQIPGLLEATYKQQSEAGNMARFKHSLEEKRQKLQGLALVGVSHSGVTLPERAATRYSDLDTAEVLLIKDRRATAFGWAVTFPDDQVLELPSHPWSKDQPQWRRAAAALLMHTVTVSDSAAPDTASLQSLAWLKNYMYVEDGLRVAMVRPDGSLSSLNGGLASTSRILTYDSEIGYEASR